MKDVMTGTYIKGNENFNFTFTTDLSAFSKMTFVNSVTDTLVDENYNSIVRDLIFDFYIIEAFTNVDISFVYDEGNEVVNPIIVIEEFLDETNIVDIVKANIKEGLIEELNNAIDANIEYRTGIHRNALNDALAGLINTLEKKLEGFDMGNAMEMVEAFSGLTGDFTPENIVDAYMKTNIAKQNIEELNESKEKMANITNEMAEVINIADKK